MYIPNLDPKLNLKFDFNVQVQNLNSTFKFPI